MKSKVERKLKRRVDRLHKSGVIHGDLKKAKILLRMSGRRARVLLTDFIHSKILKDPDEFQKREKKRIKNYN
ncbi:MAG: lipopolysaccharide kinase InaA family protein [Nitrososphaerota archaeon]|nr:lipopolysaccharide kinase InaA family protein [Nitrososphaerota archaeon]